MASRTPNDKGGRPLVLATNNRHKIAEIRAILGAVPLTILTAADFAGFPEPAETGSTLAENARIKAQAAYEATGLWSLADDSGLEVDALHGAPGVMSARFAGPGCTFADNNRKLLRFLEGVPCEKRTARFRCVAALALGEDRIELFEGVVEGLITDHQCGEGGFGYDPVFYVPELGCTFAEVTPEVKNRLSHRGRAFRAAAERIWELAVHET
jgi:XTP/dITP diphosphohydrolase